MIQLVTNKVQKVQGELMGVDQPPKKIRVNCNTMHLDEIKH